VKAALAIAVWLLTSSLAMAQDGQLRVSVFHQGSDQVGQQVAFALTEAIRGSPLFSFIDHEIAPRLPRIVVYLVSVDADVNRVTTAISNVVIYDHVSILGFGIFLLSGVQSCGQDRVEICTKLILLNIELSVEVLRKGWPELWRSLFTGNGIYSEQQPPDDAVSNNGPPFSLPTASR
jgi:hypothetical protein